MGQHKLKARVGHGSGTLVGEPGFVPLNPWGRPMPKPVTQPRPVLYQVVVRDKERGNRELRVGPRMIREMASMLQIVIAEQISLGAEKRWSDPVVVAMPS